MATPPPPDWQIPPGVSRGLWDYLHDAELAGRYDERLAGTPLAEVDVVFTLEQFPPAGRVVDLGCGTGRLLAALAARGFDCVGVDLSPEMLAVARRKVPAAEFVQANLVELDALPDASFDAAACLFSTLGMIGGADNRRRVLGHFARILKPGGVLVLHAHSKGFSVWDHSGRRWLLADVWKRFVGRPDVGDRPMPVHQGVAGLALHQFTRRELTRLLADAGFDVAVIRALSLKSDGRLNAPWWLPSWRAYGYLIAARKK